VEALLENPKVKSFAEMRPAADSFGELAFSSDSHMLAATNKNRTLLWNIDALKQDPQTKPVELHGMPGSHNALAFGPKGEWIVTLGMPASSGHLSIWTVAPDLRAQQACAVAGRNLTYDEWQRYMGQAPHRATCPQWPTGE
jgi:WD40 repeat protein